MSSKIIGCGALFYTLDTQRFLVLHRVQSKQNHVWGLVGGTTVNENLWEGLHREIKEEVGEVEIKKKIPMETFISNDEKFDIRWFTPVSELDLAGHPTLATTHVILQELKLNPVSYTNLRANETREDRG